MDTFLELVRSSTEWLGVNAAMVLLVLAAFTLISLIFPIRLLSIASVITLALAALLYQQGMDRSGLALLLMTIAILLISIERGVAQKQMRNIDHSLAVTMKAVRELQAAHERRQGFIARKMLPRMSVPQDRDHDRGGDGDTPDAMKRHVIVEEHATAINDMPAVNGSGN